MDFSIFLEPAVWAALVTLVVMEVVLGIDNLLFISIITNKLPEKIRATARNIGLWLAMAMRLVLLLVIAWIVKLTEPLFGFLGFEFSWKDLILIAGGFFLVWKATGEIHHYVDPEAAAEEKSRESDSLGLGAAVVQITMLNVVFSIDSILTAVGMTPHVLIMAIAVVLSVLIMLAAAGPMAAFVNRNPTVVMLALGFLLMIGMMLIAEGFGAHVPKGYVYTAMAFSAFVEGANIVARRRRARLAAARGASRATGA